MCGKRFCLPVVFCVLISAVSARGQCSCSAGQTVTITGSEICGFMSIGCHYIIDSNGSVTCDDYSVLDGPGATIDVNGGSFHCLGRFNVGWGSDGYINLNGGTFTVDGSLKFPDTGGGVHRIWLNAGVMYCWDIELQGGRDAVIYVGAGVLRLGYVDPGDLRYDPQQWLRQGWLQPAEGYGEIVIEDKGAYTEIIAGEQDPNRASEPSPFNWAGGLPATVSLSWSAGTRAAWHDVYLGTDAALVASADTSSPEYKGRQPVEANSYEPTAELDLGAWYWRIDEVNGANTWAGPVWSFTITSVAGADGNGVVYYEAGKFAGWPANNGLLWHWGDDEVVVGFERGEFCCISGHNICGEHYSLLARSTDAGRTWIDPPNYYGDVWSSYPSPGDINFAHPDFAMRVGDDRFFISYDRCRSWQGQYWMGEFGEATVDNWEKTSRTDYIVNGPNDCLVFMSARPPGGEFGSDRAFCVRTTDGGATFQFQGWMVPPEDPYRGVMPSTVRCSETKLVSALRRRNMDAGCDAWVDVYSSNDNGQTWTFLSRVGETGCENGNPPALVRLVDGTLCCAYGNRSIMRMYIRYSEDEGRTWGDEITLRNDWDDCAGDRQDLGYPRIAQLANNDVICTYYWSTAELIENHIAATVWHVCPRPPGDINADCVVDWTDVGLLVEQWPVGRCRNGRNCGDFNDDYRVNIRDYCILACHWLESGE